MLFSYNAICPACSKVYDGKKLEKSKVRHFYCDHQNIIDDYSVSYELDLLFNNWNILIHAKESISFIKKNANAIVIVNRSILCDDGTYKVDFYIRKAFVIIAKFDEYIDMNNYKEILALI